MPRWNAIALALTAASVLQPSQPASHRPVGAWRQYTNVRDAGYDPERLAAARAFAEHSGAGAVLLVQHGRIVVAWGNPAQRFRTYSVRKSVLSLMFGAPAVLRAFDVDATLGDLGIDDSTPLTVAERGATVGHLLSARSGVYLPAAREPPSMTASRPRRGSAAPGTSWFYNNWDFNTLGTIYQRLTGIDPITGFRTTLAEPLGLEDFRAQDGYLAREPSRSQHPAYEFHLSARDLARLGQTILQHGVWEGRTVVRREWLEQSFHIRTPFPKGGGYGYLWWIDAASFFAPEKAFPALERLHDIAAHGNGEQMLLVVPSLNIVIVHLTNRDAAKEDAAFETAELLLRARRPAPRADAPSRDVVAESLPNPPPPLPDRRVMSLTSVNLGEYAGQYEVSPGLRATISFVEGGLFVDMPGRGEAEMFPEARDRFFLKVADVVLTFERDASGAVTGVRVLDRGRPMRAKRVP